MRPAFYP